MRKTINGLDNLISRYKAPMPKFWKRVAGLMVTIGAMGGAIYFSPVKMPSELTWASTYMIAIGLCGTVLAKFASTKH